MYLGGILGCQIAWDKKIVAYGPMAIWPYGHIWVSRQLSDIFCQMGQLSDETTIRKDNYQKRQLSDGTAVAVDKSCHILPKDAICCQNFGQKLLKVAISCY